MNEHVQSGFTGPAASPALETVPSWNGSSGLCLGKPQSKIC